GPRQGSLPLSYGSHATRHRHGTTQKRSGKEPQDWSAVPTNGRRVGPGVAPWASHRSVRAQIRHTARHVTALPPRCAIRRRLVHRLPRLGVLDLLPNGGSVTRPSLPSAGSPRGEFPGFHGTTKGSDPCRPVSPDSWARPAIPPRAWISLPPRPGADR